MKLSYFTSLPHGSFCLKIAQDMIYQGFPMLFKDNGNRMVDLFTPDPDKALQWVFDKCGDGAQIEFTSYYNDEVSEMS